MHEHYQEYGTQIEVVPKKLKERGLVIDITKLPYDLGVLLLRDMGQGPGLVTKEIAKEFEERLEQLVRSSNTAHKARLSKLLNPHSVDYIF